ncbi:hypothetical protein ABZS81_31435 [Streptomyces sp. NPDC005318]|uniref:hypothetical protein n=1 Tax=Streptomyces sp. NPDC005318 TaxID=3157031 RepID=UPI0033AEDFCE
MGIAIAADHNVVQLKERLSAGLTAQGREVDDCGSHDRPRSSTTRLSAPTWAAASPTAARTPG